jgi:nucleoside-diphosphate-sugar epimerase
MIASLCGDAEAIIYISSTSVYGNYSGVVDESTKVDEDSPRSKSRLDAEKFWLKYGAIILRAPGLYGEKSGLHIRLRNGSYRLPPVNTNYISRIHLKDLARIILAAFTKPLPAGSVYLVGDFEPASQIEVVQWLCKEMNLSLPELSAPDAVPVTLTANRRINGNKILNELKLQLEFPSYREGYSHCLAQFEAK